jgi:hypothetical protein
MITEKLYKVQLLDGKETTKLYETRQEALRAHRGNISKLIEVLPRATKTKPAPIVDELVIVISARSNEDLEISKDCGYAVMYNCPKRDKIYEGMKYLEVSENYVLEATITKLEKNDPRNIYGSDIIWTDQYGVNIPLWFQHDFYQSAVIPTGDGTFTLHNSDPTQAHNVCGFVKYKNYHFVKGKLYKCGPVALFPEFDQQFQLQISNKDREILLGYQGLAVTDGPDHIKEFIQNIDKPIPQCKFCPINQQNHQIFAETKIKKHVKMVPV